MNVAETVFQHLGLTFEYQHDGTAGAAYRQRLVALIQNQYGQVYHGEFPTRITVPIVLQRQRACKER